MLDIGTHTGMSMLQHIVTKKHPGIVRSLRRKRRQGLLWRVIPVETILGYQDPLSTQGIQS